MLPFTVGPLSGQGTRKTSPISIGRQLDLICEPGHFAVHNSVAAVAA